MSGDPGDGQDAAGARAVASALPRGRHCPARPGPCRSAPRCRSGCGRRHSRATCAACRPKQVRSLCGGFVRRPCRAVAQCRGRDRWPGGEPPRARLLESIAVLLANIAEAGPGDRRPRRRPPGRCLVVGGAALLRPQPRVVTRPRRRRRPTRRTERPPRSRPGALRSRAGRRPDPPRPATPRCRRGQGAGRGGARPAARRRRLLAWLDDRARGNPLFILGLLQALQDEQADLAAPGCSVCRKA